MSRWVVEFHVREHLDDAMEDITWHVLEREGAHLNAAFGYESATIFAGEITLSGETPEVAHERIRAALQRAVISKWIGLDDLPWDFVIGEAS